MNESRRPDPDALLAQLQSASEQAARGKLKIFFGATAGVGKTYAMLQAAQQRKAEGVDVVVGYVEPHGRRETEALLEGLEQLPVKWTQDQDTWLHELDLERALARKPQLLLVDELAHSNPAGFVHARRWQDIEELRAAGIDVYTTVNVQHIESLNDVVAGVTGVHMQETVPDHVFDGADEIELVDLEPDDLLQRLRDGKVYVPAQARHALENFFRKGNLIALRELALRKTAERVDAALEQYRSEQSIDAPWAAGERVLVALGPDSDGESLVRVGKRLASALHARWLAVSVETPDLLRLPESERNRRIRWLRLAESLGAETVTLGGHAVADELLAYARTRNVTRLIIGASERRGWRRWRAALRRSTTTQLIAAADGIDVTVIKASEAQRARRNPVLARSAAYLQAPRSSKRRRVGLALTLAIVAAITAVAWFLRSILSDSNTVMLYLLGVTLVALRFGRGASVLATLASVLSYNFFFVPPVFTFTVNDPAYLITFAVLGGIGLLIGNLMASVRLQARVAGHRERRTSLLYAMSRELAATRGAEGMARVAVQHIGEVFAAQVVVLLPAADGRLAWPTSEPLPSSLRGADLAVAQWALDHGRPAGLGTDALPGASAQYLPLLGAQTRGAPKAATAATEPPAGAGLETAATAAGKDPALGVLAILPASPRRILLPEQAHLLATFAAQLALALERASLAARAEQAQREAGAESTRNALLAAISHDMRTPLAVIEGSASSLQEGAASLPPAERTRLAAAIVTQSRHLTRLIGNVLDMVRLEGGAVQLHREWTSLAEVVESTVRRLQERLAQHSLVLRIPDDLPLLYVDPVLLSQLLANLLENAAQHTPAGTHVEVNAEVIGDEMELRVVDDGPGLAADVAPEAWFEKFRRGARARGGAGLGLAICRAIAQAHGGRMRAENLPAGGAVFVLSLPLSGPVPAIDDEDEDAMSARRDAVASAPEASEADTGAAAPQADGAASKAGPIAAPP